MVAGFFPLGLVEDAAFLVFDEFAHLFADHDVVEAGVDLLVVPVVVPDFVAGVFEGDGFEVAGGVVGTWTARMAVCRRVSLKSP